MTRGAYRKNNKGAYLKNNMKARCQNNEKKSHKDKKRALFVGIELDRDDEN
ncbi:hypothetical protein GCM10023262_00310 [Bartonella pachyuromydis]|uniref:Uncharacterized protein n=1 Tax=Bartonella pachyuromydis TaxID=931097 RepID=A0ABP8VAN2_9HYPH